MMIPRVSIVDKPFSPDDQEGFGSAFGAAFLRQNTLISALHEMTDGDTATAEEVISGRASNFNPYTYLRENVDKDTLAKVQPFVSRGDFEAAMSPRQVQAIVADIQYDEELQKREGSSFLGSLAGSFVTSLIDPTSYIPGIGLAAKGSTIGKIGLSAANAVLSAGVSEAALQATQRNRSAAETIMGIGTAGVIGAGVGVFAHALGRSSLLNPDHPNNPLSPENLTANGEIVRTPDGHFTDDLSTAELGSLRELAEGGSIGAARVDANEMLAGRVLRNEPTTPIGKALRTIDDVLNSQTIAGRVVRASSDAARAIGLRIMDPGGILLDLHLNGKAIKPSAEMLKADYMSESHQLVMGLAAGTHNVNMRVAELPSYTGPKVDHADVLKLTQRRLWGVEDPAVEDALSSKYGDQAFEIIAAQADKNVAQVHALNDVWESRLVKEGVLQDAEKIGTLTTEMEKAKAEIETLKAQKDAIDPEVGGGAEIDAKLADARARRDSFKKELLSETTKAKPLGRQYGHAQMWNRDVLLENPDEFRGFLLDVLATKPDAEWLMDRFDLDQEGLEKLATQDKAKYREVLTEWAGDQFYVDLTQAEQAFKAAEQSFKTSKLDLKESLRAVGVMKREERDLTVKQARAKRDQFWSELQAVRTRRDYLEGAKREFLHAAQANRQQAAYRDANGETPIAAQRDRLVAQGDKVNAKLQTALDDALTDPATPPGRAFDAGDVVQLTMKQGRKNDAIANAETRIRQDQDNVSIASARWQGKTQEISRQLDKVSKKLATMEARAAELDARLAAFEKAEEFVRVKKEALNERLFYAKEQTKLDFKTLREAKKALRKAKGATPLEEVVDDIYRNLSNTGRLPSGIMDRIGATGDRTTGRLKERILHLDQAQRTEALQKGWLKDDLANILHSQYDQLSAEVALREGVGYGPGRQFSSWNDVMDTVMRDYDNLIQEAPDRKTKDKLHAQKRVILDDLEEARNRLKGRGDDDGTSMGWARWISAKFRAANYMRYGSGFLVSSLTDLAAVHMRHGSLAKVIFKHGREAIEEMRKLHQENPSQFQAFISSVEMGMGSAAMARRFGSEDLIHGANSNYGIGYGRTRAVTGTIDRGVERMSGLVSQLSGLPIWNRFWKTVSGIAMAHRLREMTVNYHSLKPHEIADLASLGIGRAEAERMATFIKQYGTMEDGRFDPRLEEWNRTTEGANAARDFRIAIMRDMDRAVATPGIGDTPRLMSTWWGKLWLQFQTFAFASLNRTIYPMTQRMVSFQEKQAFMSLGILMAASTFVMIGADLRNGRDPTEKFTPEQATKTLHEIIDRSGLLGWTSPYADSFLKLTSGITGYGGTSKFARNNALSSVLGINAALVSDIQSAAGSIANGGDPNVINKLLVLAPFSAQTRLFYNQLLKE
ncbi:hypothetical protein [Xanthobacter wiegelii]|uniref:hypothetical protein n=1 Tax=Xanthobacter wiegelii TaxID=3119913 RepID=UPI003727D92C